MIDTLVAWVQRFPTFALHVRDKALVKVTQQTRNFHEALQNCQYPTATVDSLHS